MAIDPYNIDFNKMYQYVIPGSGGQVVSGWGQQYAEHLKNLARAQYASDPALQGLAQQYGSAGIDPMWAINNIGSGGAQRNPSMEAQQNVLSQFAAAQQKPVAPGLAGRTTAQAAGGNAYGPGGASGTNPYGGQATPGSAASPYGPPENQALPVPQGRAHINRRIQNNAPRRRARQTMKASPTTSNPVTAASSMKAAMSGLQNYGKPLY